MSKSIKKIFTIITGLTVAVMMIVPAAPAKALTASELQTLINELMAQVVALQAQLANVGDTPTGGASPAACVGITIDRALKQGMSGTDVKCMQAILNTSSDTQIAASGVGSTGNETTYFGSLTKAGVIKFQEKYASEILSSWGLTQGTGFVGSTTRAKLNELLEE